MPSKNQRAHLSGFSVSRDFNHLSNHTMAMTEGLTAEMGDSVHSLDSKPMPYFEWKKEVLVMPKIAEEQA